MSDKKIFGNSLFENYNINEEASPEVDGKYILAKVVGEGFVPDGISRNRRFYPRQVWENVIESENIQQKLKDRNMFGTIGHELELNDDAFRKGEFSHILSNIYIDDSCHPPKGMIEILILDTPAGRVLNTLLRAKSKLYVSTRADGDFIPGKMHEGMPIVDPSCYEFFGIDYVLDPGFLKASPSLVESFKKDKTLFEDFNRAGLRFPEKDNSADIHTKNQTLSEEFGYSSETHISTTRIGENKMAEFNEKAFNESEQLLEKMTKKVTETNQRLTEVLDENAELKAENRVLKEEYEAMEKEVSDVRKDYKRLGLYEAYGDPEDIKELMDKVSSLETKLSNAEAELKDFEDELGSPEEIRAALSAAENVVDQLEEITKTYGSAEEISQAFQAAEDFINQKSEEEEELGSSDEIRAALEEAYKALNAYRALGTPKEIKQVMQETMKIANARKVDSLRESAKRIASDTGGDASIIFESLKTGASEKSIRKLLESQKKSLVKTPLSESLEKKNGMLEMFSTENRGKRWASQFSGKI